MPKCLKEIELRAQKHVDHSQLDNEHNWSGFTGFRDHEKEIYLNSKIHAQNACDQCSSLLIILH